MNTTRAMNIKSKILSRAIAEPHEESSGQPTLPVREILVPTDFSEHSTAALKYAIRFAGQVGARITLLHVIETPVATPDSDVCYPTVELINQITLAAEQAVIRICEQEKLKLPILGQTIVQIGVPPEVIKETARDQKSDLIIIATHGRTGLAHVVLGSTAEKVIRHAPCPVLVVRAR
jgi:universal stress protein A